MKHLTKKSLYLIIVVLGLVFTIPYENRVNQYTYKTSQGTIRTGWWQIGDYYTYQEINHSKVNITYTVTEETIFNGTTVYNVTSTKSEKPASIMWNVSYQENHFRAKDTYDLIGKKINIWSNAVAYYQVYTSIENVIYLNQPKLADYREGVNIWRETRYSEVTYDQSNYDEDPHAPPLTVTAETYADTNSTLIIETADVVVPAGQFNCWKIEYLYSIFPVSSAPRVKNQTTIWNRTGTTLKDGPFYINQWENSTQYNSTHVAFEKWQDNNGTVTTTTFDLSVLNKRVVYIDTILGILIKSVDYTMDSYYHGYELRDLYLASPPPTTTTTPTVTTSSTTVTTSPSETTSFTSQPKSNSTTPMTSKTTTSTTSSTTPLWLLGMLFLGISVTRRRKRKK